jgi:hypothetical protein
MKMYSTTKEVAAVPMTCAEYNELRGWDVPLNEDGDTQGWLCEDVNSPPNTKDYTGYVTWLPAAVFLSTHDAIDTYQDRVKLEFWELEMKIGALLKRIEAIEFGSPESDVLEMQYHWMTGYLMAITRRMG